MDIREAELIFEAGKKAVVKVLLEMDARIESLSQQVFALEKKIAEHSGNSTNSSKPPSILGQRFSSVTRWASSSSFYKPGNHWGPS